MALDDDAVITAAVGYVYTNTIGAAAPSPLRLTTSTRIRSALRYTHSR